MFNSAIKSGFNVNEICVVPSELEDVSAGKSIRGMETYCATWLDNDRNLRQIKENGAVEMREERAEFLRALNKRHHDYIVDTRKALAYTFSKRALYVLVDEMAEHDKALAAKAGREFCNTYDELERAIESVEQRLNGKKIEPVFMLGLDPAAVVKSQIRNRGSVRLEKMEEGKRIKVRYAVSVHQCMEALNHGWNMEMVR